MKFIYLNCGYETCMCTILAVKHYLSNSENHAKENTAERDQTILQMLLFARSFWSLPSLIWFLGHLLPLYINRNLVGRNPSLDLFSFQAQKCIHFCRRNDVLVNKTPAGVDKLVTIVFLSEVKGWNTVKVGHCSFQKSTRNSFPAATNSLALSWVTSTVPV